jgi:hypothetical protein
MFISVISLFASLFLSRPLLVLAGIGDFIFDRPLQNVTTNILLPAGSNFTVEWHIQPRSLEPPGNFTLKYRYGLWPNVGNWTTIVEDYPYQEWFIWTIPKNAQEGYYILWLTTSQKKPNLIRDRILNPFQVYQPGIIYGNSAAPYNTPQLTGSLLGLVLVILLWI